MVIIEMENGKKIKVELDPASAPISCENFEKLVREGFYDGLIFHRVIKGFMIQGGCPQGTGTGAVSYTHLDVYKRQPYRRGPAFFSAPACSNPSGSSRAFPAPASALSRFQGARGFRPS